MAFLGTLLGQQKPDPMQGLLGKFYDPQEMRKQALFDGITNAGMALLGNGQGNVGQVIGQGIGGAVQGMNQSMDTYRSNAVDQYKMQTQQDELKRQIANDTYNRNRQVKADAESAQKFGWEQQQHEALTKWLSGLPPDQQALAATDPQGAASAYLKQSTGGGGNNEYGLNMIVTQEGATDPNPGKYHLFQPSKAGTAPKEVALPYGWTPKQQFLNQGDQFAPVATQGVLPQGQAQPIPINNAQAAQQKAIGEAQGQAIVAAPKDIAAADNALKLIDDIRNDPNKGAGTGATSMFNAIPGTPGRDFQAKVDQATSGAFLTAIQQMRGLGTLSNAEGQTATAAVTRMNTATSEEAFDAALKDYEAIVMQGRMRAQQKMGMQPQAQGQAPDFSTMSDEQLQAIINGQ